MPALEQVRLLVDANTETHRIQDFLSRVLGTTGDAQQARNIVRRVMESTSAEKQLKVMLDTLLELGVIIIQDQNDVICFVVMQTAVQKLAFKMWGDMICMDWTYNTNILGFHLGKNLCSNYMLIC